MRSVGRCVFRDVINAECIETLGARWRPALLIPLEVVVDRHGIRFAKDVGPKRRPHEWCCRRRMVEHFGDLVKLGHAEIYADRWHEIRGCPRRLRKPKRKRGQCVAIDEIDDISRFDTPESVFDEFRPIIAATLAARK